MKYQSKSTIFIHKNKTFKIMKQKYRLTDETIEYDGVTLYRIEALRDIGDVTAGDKGGFVESEFNLSQEGDCWVYDEAKVYGIARVYNEAKVYEKAIVYGKATVYGKARVYGEAEVCDKAMVYGEANVCDRANIWCKAMVYGKASVCGKASIYDEVEICDIAVVYGEANVSGNAIIKSIRDYIVFKNWWSSGRYFTWTRSNNMWKVGCFYGTGEELIHKAYADSEESGKEYERVVRYVESIIANK